MQKRSEKHDKIRGVSSSDDARRVPLRELSIKEDVGSNSALQSLEAANASLALQLSTARSSQKAAEFEFQRHVDALNKKWEAQLQQQRAAHEADSAARNEESYTITRLSAELADVHVSLDAAKGEIERLKGELLQARADRQGMSLQLEQARLGDPAARLYDADLDASLAHVAQPPDADADLDTQMLRQRLMQQARELSKMVVAQERQRQRVAQLEADAGVREHTAAARAEVDRAERQRILGALREAAGAVSQAGQDRAELEAHCDRQASLLQALQAAAEGEQQAQRHAAGAITSQNAELLLALESHVTRMERGGEAPQELADRLLGALEAVARNNRVAADLQAQVGSLRTEAASLSNLLERREAR